MRETKLEKGGRGQMKEKPEFGRYSEPMRTREHGEVEKGVKER